MENQFVSFTLHREINKQLVESFLDQNNLRPTETNIMAATESLSKQILKEELEKGTLNINDFQFTFSENLKKKIDR